MEPKEGYVVYGKLQGNEYKVWFETYEAASSYADEVQGFVAMFKIEKVT